MSNSNCLRAVVAAAAIALLSTAGSAKDAFPNEVASDEDAIRLTVESDWVVDYGDDYCRLTRFFVDGGDRYVLSLQQNAPGHRLSLIIAGPELDHFQRGALDLGLETDLPMRENIRVQAANNAALGPAIVFPYIVIGVPIDSSDRLPGIDLAAAGKIDRVVVKRRGRIISFETGNMGAPFEALNTCAQDFFTVWGLDAEEHRGYTQAKLRNEYEFARAVQENYPKEALKAEESGNLTLRVIVEPDGSVSDCHTVQNTKAENLQSAACEEIDVAKFDPARNASGNPIRSFYVTTVTYLLN